jgi:imidazolonepropionase-like amidohydrolase
MARLALAALAIACTSARAPSPPATLPPVPPLMPALFQGSLALEHVNVEPMTDAGTLLDQTLVIENGRIVALGNSGEVAIPDGAARPDVAGAFVLPGLIDAHVHLQRSDLPAYLAAGITTVRNMWGTPLTSALRGELADPATPAGLPTILSASPGLDDDPPSWPYTQIVKTPADAVAAVDREAAAGWEYIKVYNRLSPESYAAILGEARRLNIPVVGHVPFAVDAEVAMQGGQRSIEHLTGYPKVLTGDATVHGWATADPARFAALAQETARSGTWNCPTLAVVDVTTAAWDDWSEIHGRRAAFVKALADANAPLVAGTDSGIGLVDAGSSLHLELRDWVAAGVPPEKALRAATSDAARFLALEAEIGTIAVGKRADLLLLKRDPLLDLAALDSPRGVVLRGAWLPQP